MKGEFETMERYVQELEALMCYAQVKAGRDSLATEVAQLRQKVTQLMAQVGSEISRAKELSSQLSKREAEVKELGVKATEAQEELSSLRDFKLKLPEGGGLPLEEMKERFLHAQDREIDRRVKERLIEMERDTRSRMPALVQKELRQVLKSTSWPPEIEKVVNSRVRRMADESLRNKGKWPDWFKNYYLREVKEAVAKGLGSEFESRVHAEAQKRLDTVKTDQWEKYAAAKARGLAMDLSALVSQLQGSWWFNCDRCGRRLALDIGPSEIGELLGGRTVDVACSSCTDPAPLPFILSTIPHKLSSLTLGDLLQLYIGKVPAAE